MMEKKEIIEGLNEFFGFEVRWEKLSKRDLEKIYEFLDDPRNMIKRIIEVVGVEKFVRYSNDVFANIIIEKRPIRSWIERFLFGDEGE